MQNQALINAVKMKNFDFINEYDPKDFILDKKDNTLLHLAVATHDLELVQLVYSKTPYALGCKNIYSMTPMEMSRNIMNKSIYNFFKTLNRPVMNAVPVYNYDIERIECALQIKNKYIIKLINEEKKKLYINIGLYNMILFIKSLFPDIDENLLRPLFKNNLDLTYFSHGVFNSYAIKILFKRFHPKKIIKMITNTYKPNFSLLMTVSELDELSIDEIDNLNINEISSFLDIKSAVENYICKRSQKDFKLKQRFLHNIFKKYSTADTKYLIPRTNYELISLAEKFKNCVGNGYYSTRIQKKDIFILGIYKRNKPYACIEIDFYKWEINSIKGVRNMYVQKDSSVQEKIIEIKKKNSFWIDLRFFI